VARVSPVVEIIVCDLLPLRERAKYIGYIFIAWVVAIAIGPVVGGAFADRDWSWCFWINLPICGVAFVLLYFFLDVQYRKDAPKSIFKRIDFGGNALLIASVIAVLLALAWGGTRKRLLLFWQPVFCWHQADSLNI
jgi:MFS family permease